MLQADRNALYDVAYGLDNHSRLYIPKRLLKNFRPVVEPELSRRRMQDKEDNLYVLYGSNELERIADQIRTLVACDEATLASYRRSR